MGLNRAVPVGYRSGASNTPDIQVSYRSFDTTTDASSDLVLWNNDYGDLNKVAYAKTNGLGAEITLTQFRLLTSFAWWVAPTMFSGVRVACGLPGPGLRTRRTSD